MKTLQDAWDWYQSATANLVRMRRLGTHHWNDLSLLAPTASIWKDERFKQLEAADMQLEASRALEPLEDLGVLVLFSVLEAAVRDHLETVIQPLTLDLGHSLLTHAAKEVIDGIRQGSFANKVLTPLQDQNQITPQLSDKVRQVRDYRNWVAHGKREPRPRDIVNLSAQETYRRLKEFLDVLCIAVEAELIESAKVEEGGAAPE